MLVLVILPESIEVTVPSLILKDPAAFLITACQRVQEFKLIDFMVKCLELLRGNRVTACLIELGINIVLMNIIDDASLIVEKAMDGVLLTFYGKDVRYRLSRASSCIQTTALAGAGKIWLGVMEVVQPFRRGI
jgi:hypothetical protein